MNRNKLETSIIICTYNREKLLPEVLRSLLNQTFDKSGYEIIVIDNGSTDNTSQLIKSFQLKYPKSNIVYLLEPNYGLARARNRGYKMAKGRYVAFLDDDAMVERNWLSLIHSYSQKVCSQVIAIGGPIIPYYNSPKPSWFKDEYEFDAKGDKPRFLKMGESFSGSNMIWRKEYLEKFGGFPENVGMKKNVMSVGEETVIFEKIWRQEKNNNIFYYFPDLLVFHLVPAEKMDPRYRLLRWFAYGQSLYIRNMDKNIFLRIIESAKVFGYFVISLVLAIAFWVRYRYYQNWVVEKVGPLMFVAGYFSSFSGLKIQPKQRF